MLERIYHYLTYLLPWWLQPLILVVIGVVVSIFVYRLVGFRGLIATIVAFSALIVGRGTYKKGQSDGYSAAKTKVKSDADRLIEEAKRARERVAADIRNGSVYDDDGFKRPD